MGFWGKRKKKKSSDTENAVTTNAEQQGSERASADRSDWDRVVYSRKDLNIDDAAERREYVENCLMQMAEGTSEIENLQFEYRTVTAYLHDLDEIDALPEDKKTQLAVCATRIKDNSQKKAKFLESTDKLTEHEYEKMERLGDDAAKTILRIEDAEKYQVKIRNDLKRLDGEHQAYNFRKEEVSKALENSRGLIYFVAVAFVVIMAFLYAIWSILHLDVTYACMLSVLAAALAVAALYVSNMNEQTEKKRVSNAISRLIQLQNTVKIRYVNNRNLLDYLYIKYDISNSAELEKLVQRYEKERAQREIFRDAQKLLDENEQDLLFLLKNFNVNDPEIWLSQYEVLLNHNEEVEARHRLIVRRQSLRKRMDYNRETVVGNARAEIEDLARSYPRYAQEILEDVSRYQQEKGLE